MKESIVISGSGIEPCLLAFCLQRLRPDWRVHLVVAEGHLPDGDAIPISLEGVSEALIAVIDPAIVIEWPHYHLLFDGSSRQLKGRVAMIAPEQLSAEILEVFPPEQIRRDYAWDPDVPGLQGRPTVIECGGDSLDAHSVVVTTQTYLCAEFHALAAPVLIDASGTWSETDFLQYFPSSSHQLQIRYIASDREMTTPPLLDKNWSQAQLIGQRCERIGWEGGPASQIGENRILLPTMGARHQHPAFLSSMSHILYIAEVLARSTTTTPDVLLVHLTDAQARRVNEFHAWRLVNDLLATLGGDAKRRVLTALYARP